MRPIKCATYPERTFPTNGGPEVLEEPLLRSSGFFGPEIPLVPLKTFAFSAIGQQEEGKEVRWPLRGHTKNPGRVHRSRYISDRRKPSAPTKYIDEDDRTSHECPELILHGEFL